MQGEPSPAVGVLDLPEDDPFSTEVKVSLPGATTKPSTPSGKDGQGEQPEHDEPNKDGDPIPEDSGGGDGTDAELFAGDEDQGEEGGEGGGKLRKNLQAARRNAKRLRRALNGQSQYVAGLQQQVAGLQATVTALAKSQVDGKLATAKAELNRLTAERRDARTADDAAREAEIEDRIARVRAEMVDYEKAIAEIDSYRPTTPTNAMLADWVETNGDWYRRPGFEKETAAAVRISQDLTSQGINAFNPRHFEALNDALIKQFPRLAEQEVDADAFEDAGGGAAARGGRQQQPQQQRRSVMRGVAPGGRPAAGGGGNKGPMVPKAMVDSFKAAGFDTSKPEVQKMMYSRYQETAERLSRRAGS